MIRQVLLAAKVSPDDPDLAYQQLSELRYPVLMSPKIDGIRCHVERCTLGLPVVLSRKNKAIPNEFIRQTLSKTRFLNLDGELVVGPPNCNSCYNTTASGVMSHAGEPDFKFLVFDYTASPYLAYQERYTNLQIYFRGIANHDPVKLIPQRFAYSVDDVIKYETLMIAKGWEGIMVRSLMGQYKEGRSTLREQILIKVKRFVDGEAEILGCYEQETNLNEAKTNEIGRSKRSSHKENKVPNGHLGGFHVRDISSGVEFDVGTMDGITKAQRKLMWEGFRLDPSLLLGKTVKYKKFPVGEKDKPRHPILLGFRDPIDIGEVN